MNCVVPSGYACDVHRWLSPRVRRYPPGIGTLHACPIDYVGQSGAGVEGDAGASAASSVIDPEICRGFTGLVGRAPESALLRDRLREVWAGTGHVVLLSGEAGLVSHWKYPSTALLNAPIAVSEAASTSCSRTNLPSSAGDLVTGVEHDRIGDRGVGIEQISNAFLAS